MNSFPFTLDTMNKTNIFSSRLPSDNTRGNAVSRYTQWVGLKSFENPLPLYYLQYMSDKIRYIDRTSCLWYYMLIKTMPHCCMCIIISTLNSCLLI